jgi:hypothetical protein
VSLIDGMDYPSCLLLSLPRNRTSSQQHSLVTLEVKHHNIIYFEYEKDLYQQEPITVPICLTRSGTHQQQVTSD